MSKTDYALDAKDLLEIIDRNPDLAGNPEATAEFIAEQIEQVKSALAGLDVDSDFVHASTVSVNHATNP